MTDRFDGSESNLRQFFDRKSTKLARILKSETDADGNNVDDGSEVEAANVDEVAILHLFLLCREILFEEDSSKVLAQVCQSALKAFQRWLYIADVAADSPFPKPITEEISTKMILILLLLMIKCQQTGFGNYLLLITFHVFAVAARHKPLLEMLHQICI